LGGHAWPPTVHLEKGAFEFAAWCVLLQENEDQGDTRRAFQKMLVEMQKLRDSYATLRAELNDRSAGWAEQGPTKAREEVLLNQIQQLEERLKQFETQSGW